MISIWERNQFQQYDIIIIGSGIVGLFSAFYAKQREPKARILILERGLLPSGASTRNAGFACMGSVSELLDDLVSSTEMEVLELYSLRRNGLLRMRSVLGDQAIGYKTNGSHELLYEEDIALLDKVEYLNSILKEVSSDNAFRICNDKISSFQFNPQQVKGMIENCLEAEIDTGLMMQTLLNKVMALGVEIRNGSNVLRFEEENKEVRVYCENPLSNNPIEFIGKHLFICNNAFASSLLPNYDVVPGRGQVLITKPINKLAFKGIFHFDKGYYYFREYQGSVIFGGGRNLDFKTEETNEFGINPNIQRELERLLREVILPENNFEIDLRWSGIMAFGKTKRPIVKMHGSLVAVGVRMGGMGVAIGSEVGYQLCELVFGKE